MSVYIANGSSRLLISSSWSVSFIDHQRVHHKFTSDVCNFDSHVRSSGSQPARTTAATEAATGAHCTRASGALGAGCMEFGSQAAAELLDRFPAAGMPAAQSCAGTHC